VITDVVSRFPPDGALLDLGGGNGFMTRALDEAGFPAVLVEPVPEGARTAHERGLRPVVCSTIGAAGFPAGSLPAVAMFDVLEHLDDDVAHLRLVRDLLVPGGRLYLTVPKHPGLWSAHDEAAGHQRRYTTKSLLAVVRDGGFEVEHHTSFFAALVVPMAVRRVLPGGGGASVADPTSGRGVVARSLRRVLSHERSALGRRSRHLGTSLLVVARRG
jgi:SAM-dependent methyltransferase